MGYWADYDNAYWTMNPDYVESVWWALKKIFDKGLLVEDYRVAPYCPRCGTGLSDHEVAQGYEDVVDPSVYVRFPLTSGPWAGKARPAGLDDDAVDARLQHRRRGEPGRHLRGRAHRRGARSSCAEALLDEGARRRRRGAGRVTPARDLERLDLPAARSTSSPLDGRELRRARRLRHHRRRHRPGAPGARVRRRRPRRRRARTACRWSTRSAATGTSLPDVPLVGGLFFKDADEQLVADLRGARPAVPARALRAQLPALLALPHAAHVLRAAVLVHPHDRDQGPAARRERGDELVPGRRSSTAATATGWTTTSTGRSRATGTGARRCRCGATTPIPSRMVCVGSLAELRELSGVELDRPAPAVRRRRDLHPSGRGGHVPPRAAGDRRVVRLRLDAVRPVRRAAPQRRRGARPPTRPTSSARRSTRPAAGSTR